MSYSCLISFKKLNPADIIPFLVSFKKSCTKHLKDIAQDEYGYCPFIRNSLTVPDNFTDITVEERQKAQAWAHELFKFKYFYNTELGLLGVFGVPAPLTVLFDGTIPFQNSTDQDYEREMYNGITQFDAIFCKWMTMPDADFREEYAKRKNESFDDYIATWHPEILNNEIKIEQKKAYYKRTFCYEEIWSRFEKHLWNDEQNIFFSVYGPYERQEVMRFVKHCYDAQVETQKNYLS